MQFGLIQNTIDSINSVFSEFAEVNEVILYGSRAKGNFRNGSDIDLVVKGNGLNLETLNAISLRLDDLYLPYTFDIALQQHIRNQDLVEHINRVGITFFKRSKGA